MTYFSGEKKRMLLHRLRKSCLSLLKQNLPNIGQTSRWQSSDSKLLIWASNCPTAQKSAPTILLMGYSGSTPAQIEPYSELYTSLGYNSISCIMPHEYTLSFDIPSIRQCAKELLAEVDQSGAKGMVCHTFSGNGLFLYQQLYWLLQENGRLEDSVKVEILIFVLVKRF